MHGADMDRMAVEKLSVSYVKVPEITNPLSHLKTIPEVLEHYAQECPDREAMVFVSTDENREAVTFKDLYEKSKIVAHNLVTLGVKPKEIVGINLRTCPEWLYVAFGAMMAGAVPTGAAFTYKDGSDLIALMETLKTCSCLVIDPGFEDENWNILSKFLDEYSSDGSVTSLRMPFLRYLLCHDPDKSLSGIKPLKEIIENTSQKHSLPDIHGCDIAALLQTSGSTGNPKAVIHTHASLLALTRTDLLSSTSKFSYFCDRPFQWMGGYPRNVLMGQTRVTCSGFNKPPTDRARFLTDVILQERCEIVMCLPGIIPEVTKHYSSGYALSGMEVKVVDEEERTLPVNTRGEIYVKSKQLFKGYYNDKEKTRAVLTADGWFKTDDLGRILEDGSLMVEGRQSNMIISGGMNVVPEILETTIAKCPGVESVVIVPVPDAIMYQVICACVKPVPGSDVTEKVVRTFCEDAHGDKLGLFTILPKYYIILKSFPETSTGKIARKALATLAEKTCSI